MAGDPIPLINDGNVFYNTAHDYLTLGFSVIPIQPRGKKPLIAWEPFQQKKVSNKMLKNWSKKWPTANIGIVTGRISGILVVDIDSPEGRENYIAQFGEVHNTISQKTGKDDGAHLVFRHPGFICSNRAALLPDVDIRGDGGYIVAPPSIHPSGGRYRWIIDPVEYGLGDLMDCPKELLAMLRDDTTQGDEKTEGPGNYEHWVQDALEGVSEGQRNDMCAKLAGYFLRALKGNVPATEKILLEWNERNDPPMQWKEVSQTIRSIHSRQSIEELRIESGVEIEKIKNYIYPDGEHIFSVLVRGYEIEMSIDTLASPVKCLNKIAEKTHHVGQVKNRSVWLSLINPILDGAEIAMMSEDETMIGIVRDVVTKSMREDDDLARINDRPCIKDDVLYVKISAIMNEMGYEQISIKHPREAGKILRDLGFEKGRVRTKSGQAMLWKISLTEFQRASQ